MENRFLIYGLRDPRTDEYRYIGKSATGIKRANSHLLYSHNDGVNQWVYELRELGLVPHIDVLEICDEENLSPKEKFWVKHYEEAGAELLNKISYQSFHVKAAILELERLKSQYAKEIEDAKYAHAKAMEEIEGFTLGEFIKKRRKQSKIKQKDFSEIAGISQRTLRKLEMGDGNQRLSTLVSTLAVLGYEIYVRKKKI